MPTHIINTDICVFTHIYISHTFLYVKQDELKIY